MNKRNYYSPTQLAKEPFLTVWHMENPSDTICWIQCSEDQEKPNWLKFGEVFEQLACHIADIEKTILADMLIALRCNEAISNHIIKKYIIK